ncbi:MAG: polyphosphate kinase 1 [Rhodospirillales bacterium]|jgi:polyphosphate kinase|nr:polyphosphate kinase 1 [Rhodospirillales bacterium]
MGHKHTEAAEAAEAIVEGSGSDGNAPTPAVSPDDEALYLNRELSLLEFQRRVLEEAMEADKPLLERVSFIAIFGSNIDELFMVRVAALKQQVAAGSPKRSLDGLTAAQQLKAIREAVIDLTAQAYACWHQQLVPALAAADIHIVGYPSLSDDEKAALKDYFSRMLYPVLTPQGVDAGRPFPHISGLSVSLVALVKDARGDVKLARVKVPESLPQLLTVPDLHGGRSGQRFIWIEEVVKAHLGDLFPGLEIVETYPIRVTRDAEVAIKEIESDDLLSTIAEEIWKRRFRGAVRLQVAEDLPDHMVSLLASHLDIDGEDIYRFQSPMALKRLWQVVSLDRPDLKHPPLAPVVPKRLRLSAKQDIFAAIREGDILLHHPYESFQPVVDLLRTAAFDPDVLAIKMTLYRTGRKSPVVEALFDAAEEGKQVVVLVELKARFDEESNIDWARALEAKGVHVVYGIVGLKVHCKTALVVRREGDTMRKYVHLGTGNYNAATARIYTDLGLLTCDDTIGNDAVALFDRLTAYEGDTRYQKLLVAPRFLRPRLAELIEREIAHAAQGRPARIIAKANGLDHPEMITRLYRASQAGVTIDLLIRGICSLKPGVPGVSETITVTSIVGRFLEHSRIYWFANGGNEEVYVGSADLLPRNLDHRVEVVFPIEDPRLVRRIRDEVLEMQLQDSVNARRLRADGHYELRRPERGMAPLDSHARFIEIAGS